MHHFTISGESREIVSSVCCSPGSLHSGNSPGSLHSGNSPGSLHSGNFVGCKDISIQKCENKKKKCIFVHSAL